MEICFQQDFSIYKHHAMFGNEIWTLFFVMLTRGFWQHRYGKSKSHNFEQGFSPSPMMHRRSCRSRTSLRSYLPTPITNNSLILENNRTYEENFILSEKCIVDHGLLHIILHIPSIGQCTNMDVGFVLINMCPCAWNAVNQSICGQWIHYIVIASNHVINSIRISVTHDDI